MAKAKIKPIQQEAPKELVITLFSHEAKIIHDALMCCVSKEETRYYLNGVCFDFSAEGLIGVATDGHRLGKLILNPVEKIIDEKGKEVWTKLKTPISFANVIAPTRFIKALGALPDGKLFRDICTLTIKDGWIHYNDSNEGFSAKLIDGNFPDWRRVFPKETDSQEPMVSFNTKYLSQLALALQKVNGKGAGVAFKIKNKLEPVVMNCRKNEVDLSYCIMPMRF